MSETKDGELGTGGRPADVESRALEQTYTNIAAKFDADSYDILASVLYRDTADAREIVARQYSAETVTELGQLIAEQSAVGTKEQMDAIKRTGVCPDTRFWFVASWLLVLVDVVFWSIASAQVFAF